MQKTPRTWQDPIPAWCSIAKLAVEKTLGMAPLTLRHPTHDRGSAEKVYFMTCFGAVVVGYTLFRGPDE